MAQFTDKAGETWAVEIDYGLLGLVRKETGLDLAKAMGDADGLLPELLYGDPGNLIAVLFVICEPGKKGLSPEDWGRRFSGPAIEGATQALLEAIADFFPRSAVAAKIREKLPLVLARVDERAIDAIERAFSKWDTDSRVPSGSSSTATPCGP